MGGTLTVNGTVSYNTTTMYDGGGIENMYGGVLTVNGTVSNNTAATVGGGIFNHSTATLNFGSGNSVQNNSAASSGGGIYNQGGTVNAGANCSGNSPENYAPGGPNCP